MCVYCIVFCVCRIYHNMVVESIGRGIVLPGHPEVMVYAPAMYCLYVVNHKENFDCVVCGEQKFSWCCKFSIANLLND